MFGILAVVLQTTLSPVVACCGGAPDVVFLFVVFLALQRRTTLGLWFAFALGLVQDVAGGGPLGLNPSILVAVAYLVSLLRTKLFKENYSAQVLIVVLLTCAQQFFMFYWMNTLLNTEFQLGQWLSRAAVMSLYHALLGPPLFAGLARLIPGDDVYQHLILGGPPHTPRLRFRRMG